MKDHLVELKVASNEGPMAILLKINDTGGVRSIKAAILACNTWEGDKYTTYREGGRFSTHLISVVAASTSVTIDHETSNRNAEQQCL
jgi:hypothetical protein